MAGRSKEDEASLSSPPPPLPSPTLWAASCPGFSSPLAWGCGFPSPPHSPSCSTYSLCRGRSGLGLEAQALPFPLGPERAQVLLGLHYWAEASLPAPLRALSFPEATAPIPLATSVTPCSGRSCCLLLGGHVASLAYSEVGGQGHPLPRAGLALSFI